MGETFRLNEPQVACEVLDGDMILLHFASGLYYNVRGTGADICQCLLAGGSLTQAIEGLSRHFSLPPLEVAQDVKAFVEELQREGLLVACDPTPSGARLTVTASNYAPPRCEKFDDMADQLLLDKIDDQAQDAQWASPPSL